MASRFIFSLMRLFLYEFFICNYFSTLFLMRLFLNRAYVITFQFRQIALKEFAYLIFLFTCLYCRPYHTHFMFILCLPFPTAHARRILQQSNRNACNEAPGNNMFSFGVHSMLIFFSLFCYFLDLA